MSYSIGIDLGGTNIKAVAVSDEGEVLAQSNAPTSGEDGAAVAENVARQLAALEAEAGRPASAVGLAAPGMVARDGRSMASISGHLEIIEGLDWADHLRGHRPSLLNDAHAALLGEVWRGAAAGARDAVLLTLGTGVGGAILSEGRLLRGRLGRAGHLGHMCLDVDAARDRSASSRRCSSASGPARARRSSSPPAAPCRGGWPGCRWSRPRSAATRRTGSPDIVRQYGVAGQLAVVGVRADRRGDGVLLRAAVAALRRDDRPRVLRAALLGQGRVARARLPRRLPRAVLQLLHHGDGQRSRRARSPTSCSACRRGRRSSSCGVLNVVFAAHSGLWGVLVIDMIQFFIKMTAVIAAAYFRW
jgi:hypothetical protein